MGAIHGGPRRDDERAVAKPRAGQRDAREVRTPREGDGLLQRGEKEETATMQVALGQLRVDVSSRVSYAVGWEDWEGWQSGGSAGEKLEQISVKGSRSRGYLKRLEEGTGDASCGGRDHGMLD
jgi:hypothetical protein